MSSRDPDEFQRPNDDGVETATDVFRRGTARAVERGGYHDDEARGVMLGRPERPLWHRSARCRGVVDWYSTRWGDAAEVCALCPVRADCLQAALENAEPAGIWGGVDFDRDRAANRRKKDARRRREGQTMRTDRRRTSE